jgi:2-keto-4-pentenoate hydratase/2-oxohepta-3-ene-1,7-dioic acid hydratase in catechol pathway
VRFLSFRIDNQHSFGALIENRVVDLGRRMSGYQNLREVIAAGALVRAKDIAAESSADYELAELTLVPPVPEPSKVICIEAGNLSGADRESDHPHVYLRTAESLVGHLQHLLIPLESTSLDCRGALALIVGSGGRRITEKAARDAIAGITLANDTTVRDWPLPGGQHSALARNFPQIGSIGPWLVTLDDITDFDDLIVTTRINDDEKQQSSSARLEFSLSYLIGYLSSFLLLKPGDVILIAPPQQAPGDQLADCTLAPGDQVEIENPDLGKLSNSVVAERETINAD